MMPEQPERIIRLRTVLALTGLSRSTLYRKIENGEFPRQIKISERCVGWYGSMVNDWLDRRRAENGDDVRESRAVAAG